MPLEKVDIHRVATMAGVSPATVSRTLNHPDIVRPQTRKRILSVIEKIGYIPNRAATSIHRKNTNTIGLIIPTIDSAIFSRMILGFSRQVEALGFMTMMATHNYDLNLEQDIVHRLIEHRVDGIAWVGIEHTDTSMRMLRQHRLPSVSLWNFHPNHPMPCVGIDNYLVGCAAAQHLIDLGHRDIAIISARLLSNDRARQRYDGATDTLHKANIPLRPEWDIMSAYHIAETKKNAIALLQQSTRPTAVICGNDVQAFGVIYAALYLGIPIPEQLSVIGVGDLDGSAEITPSLSTIAVPSADIGRKGAQTLFKQIEEHATTLEQETDQWVSATLQLDQQLKSRYTHYHTQLEGKLIQRQSTAAPPTVRASL